MVLNKSSGVVNLNRLESIIPRYAGPILILFSAFNFEIGSGAFVDRMRLRYADSGYSHGNLPFGADIVFQNAPVHRDFRRAIKTSHTPPDSFEKVDNTSIMISNTVTSTLTFITTSKCNRDHEAKVILAESDDSQSICFRIPF